jgi:hypothetical protein
VPVGNQTENGKLKLVPLKELLDNPAQYMSTHDKGKIKGASLLAKRDTHVLVSAQHAFLPVPKQGQATFWPVIFNYQSTKKNPAVLTILVTRQGTSVTIVDNARDTVGGSWGQRLYFNQAGKRAPLIAERLADVKASGVTANGEDAQDLNDDANVLMLIQVLLGKLRAPKLTYSPMKKWRRWTIRSAAFRIWRRWRCTVGQHGSRRHVVAARRATTVPDIDTAVPSVMVRKTDRSSSSTARASSATRASRSA